MHNAESADAPAWARGPYSVKRHGATITDCDSEPVHTPGCVQDHGVLLVLRPAALTVAQASENAQRWLGISAAALLDQPVAAAIGVQHEAQLRDFLANEPIERNPLYVFKLPPDRQRAVALDVIVHTIDGVVVLECEADHRIGGELTTENTRDPSEQRPGQHAERRRGPNYYALGKKTVARLQGTDSLQQFCDIAAQEFRELAALDRVMIYKFHADGHGEVVAESKRADLPSWLGLHYPADDIPKSARDIFTKIWLRPLPDVDAPQHELVPLAHPDTGQPLDMTHCALRGASVMYTEYLRNMKVRASLTMPIRHGDALWGLIAGHHYTGPAQRAYEVRAACEFLAQVVSIQQRSAEDREHLHDRLNVEGAHNRLIAAAARQAELGAIISNASDLLAPLGAGGAALLYGNRWWCAGATPTDAQLDLLAAWLGARPELSGARPFYATACLARDYPAGAEFADVASGVLAVPLARRAQGMLLWFRPETIQTIHWGGNPHDKPAVPGPHGPRLTPRVSFEIFTESVRQRAYPWRSIEVEATLRLRLLIMELVVARAEQLAALNKDLLRSNGELDAFVYVASHDLKEPLRGIRSYAQQMLDDAHRLSAEQNAKLEALLRLTKRMDSLLDSLLNFARAGRGALRLEHTDLNQIFAEAIEMIGTSRAEARTEFIVAQPLPHMNCDPVQVREVFVNLLANALKYNDKPIRRVTLSHFSAARTRQLSGEPPQASGQTVFALADNGIGIARQHFDQVFGIFKRLHGRDEYGGGVGAGLTIVKKLIERHGGTIWLDSAPDQGTTFYFTLAGQS